MNPPDAAASRVECASRFITEILAVLLIHGVSGLRRVPMSSTLTIPINRRALRRMAGARSYERGEGYAAIGRIGALSEHDGTITAKVHASPENRVTLWVEDEGLESSCTCRVGANGAFCKHCVAVGLVWLEQGSKGGGAPKVPGRPAVTMEDVRQYLAGQDKNALVDILLEQAMDDDRLRRRFLMKAAKREKDHAEDSLASYKCQVEPTLNRKNDEAYGKALGLLRRIHLLMGRLGRSCEFPRYLESARSAHKPKRNFMKLLERAKWS